MNDYELVFVVHPELDENAFKELLEKIKGWIAEAGGQVTKVDLWGKRRLSYIVRKQREGIYVVMQANMAPASCAILERNLRFQEPVLRFLLTQK
jgi:small subunit ribosomal protein S6